MPKYKTVNVPPDDYDRLARLANGMPLGRMVGLMLDALEKNNLRIVEISTLPAPEGAIEVPLVKVSAGE